MFKQLLKSALLGCGVVTSITLPVLGMGCSKPQDTVGQSRASPTARKPADIQITAVDLSTRYHTDETAADEAFRGKHITLTGAVIGIKEDMMGFKYVELKGENDYQFVNATLNNKELSKIEFLKKGQSISVQCVGEGQRVGSPILDDCKIL